MAKKILIAVDQSAPAARAVDVAIELARDLHADLAAIHVVDVALAFLPEYAVIETTKMAELRQIGNDLLDEVRARVPQGVRLESFLVEGDPPEEILAKARTFAADLIVIGSESRGRLAHFVLGSTADSVIRRSACPVVSVRAEVPALTKATAAAVA